ncbi:MAG: hypothetical protein ACKOXC_06845 [Aquirufa sp.]
MFKRFAFNWTAQTAHGLHSPFVFDLYTQVIDPIYQSAPQHITEALIHGIGQHLKLAAGKLHVIDMDQVQINQLNLIDELMQDTSNLIICMNIRQSDETLQNWQYIAAKEQAIHSIELYELGIISLNPIAPKQFFRLKKS